MSDISDEELKVFMGEKVMGWHQKEALKYASWYDSDGNVLLHETGWNPLSDLNQAMECVEKVCEDSKCDEFELLLLDTNRYYSRLGGKEKLLYSSDKIPARAVCLAVRAFVKERG